MIGAIVRAVVVAVIATLTWRRWSSSRPPGGRSCRHLPAGHGRGGRAGAGRLAAGDLPAAAGVGVRRRPGGAGRRRTGRRRSWTGWPGCWHCPAPAPCTPTPGCAPSCGRWPADRLRWSLAVDLDGDPASARAALGEAGWALLARDQRDLPDREGTWAAAGGAGRADRQPGAHRRARTRRGRRTPRGTARRTGRPLP
jgi:hypothetical protein